MYARGGNTTIKWGLYAGIALTVGDLFFFSPALLHVRLETGSAGFIFFLIAALLVGLASVAALFVAGILAARDTGLARSGASVGVLAIIVSGLVVLLMYLLLFSETPLPSLAEFGISDEEFRRVATGYLIVSSMCSLVIGAAAGAGIGALGGLIGRTLYDDGTNVEALNPALEADLFYYSGYMPAVGYPPAGAYSPPTGYPLPPPSYPPAPTGFSSTGDASASGGPPPPAERTG